MYRIQDATQSGRSGVKFPKSILLATLCCGLLWPGSALAGQIFGQIRVEGSLAKAGLEVWVECPGRAKGGRMETDPSGSTDQFGSYRVHVPAVGNCSFKIDYRDQVLDHRVLSYIKPTQFNFHIRSSGGEYSLRQE